MAKVFENLELDNDVTIMRNGVDLLVPDEGGGGLSAIPRFETVHTYSGNASLNAGGIGGYTFPEDREDFEYEFLHHFTDRGTNEIFRQITRMSGDYVSLNTPLFTADVRNFAFIFSSTNNELTLSVNRQGLRFNFELTLLVRRRPVAPA